VNTSVRFFEFIQNNKILIPVRFKDSISTLANCLSFQVCFKEKQSRDTNPAPAPASPVLPTEEKIIEKPTMPSSSCKYPGQFIPLF